MNTETGRKRVVVTGRGIVSCIGNNIPEVTRSLREIKSGIVYNPSYEEAGLACCVSGSIKDIDAPALIPRAHLRFISDSAIFSYIALNEAIKEAELPATLYEGNTRAGVIAASGGTSPFGIISANDIRKERGVRRMGPYLVTKTMNNGISAALSTFFKVRGANFSVTSACATSQHCVGIAYQYIASGLQDIVFAGGGEEEHAYLSMMFDAMGALSRRNDDPQSASRPFDTERDGFVPGGGGGMLVLESLEHAKARGANILCEIVGFGFSSDGEDIVAPSGEGAVQCMQMALEDFEGKIDYVNAHGTSTPVGDSKELSALKEVFGKGDVPPTSSTKSLTGHSLGATGVQELIYSMIMMEHGFITPTLNLKNVDPEGEGVDLVKDKVRETPINAFLNNSFGFGGTNATLIATKYQD